MAVLTYQDCRALRHAYERMQDAPEDRRGPPETGLWHSARYIIFLRCLRCTTYRYIAIDRHGGKLASIYRHPDDYLRPAGEPRVTQQDMYLWLAKPRNGRR